MEVEREQPNLSVRLCAIALAFLGYLAFSGGCSSIAETNQSALCVRNLRSLGRALSLYVEDYGDRYPPPIQGNFVNAGVNSKQTWGYLLMPYLKQAKGISCPGVLLTPRMATHAGSPLLWGYAINGRLSETIPRSQGHIYQGRIGVSIRFPQLTVTLFDARAGMVTIRGPDTATSRESLYGVYPRDFVEEILSKEPGALRHKGKANYLFADGHIGIFAPTDLKKDPKSGGASPGFGL